MGFLRVVVHGGGWLRLIFELGFLGINIERWCGKCWYMRGHFSLVGVVAIY